MTRLAVVGATGAVGTVMLQCLRERGLYDEEIVLFATERSAGREIDGRIVQARAAEAGFVPRDFGGHSLKRGALTTGMEGGAHPAQLKRLGRHKSFDMLGEYLEFGDLFDAHPLGGVL